MELVKRTVYMVVRIYGTEDEFGDRWDAITAFSTPEEAAEKLEEFKTCLGEFTTMEADVWVPPGVL